MKCVVCNNKGNNEFPVKDKIITLCGSCFEKVRESIGGINDGIPEYISQDIVIKSIAMDFYERHGNKLGIACDTLCWAF